MPNDALKRLIGPVPTDTQALDPQGSWEAAPHVWAESELNALAAAVASGRPLLIKGEPGVGKSQIARAAAARLGWRFLYDVITPRYEPQDLKWRFDAVQRLSDASPGGSLKTIRHYYTAGVLWQAIDPESANPDGKATQQTGSVLLLDEIDKADTDLPNSLLEVLANRSFHTPWGQRIPASENHPAGLLIVVTSNGERELPLAFTRRCVVLDIKIPDEKANAAAFDDWLIVRGQAHFDELIDAEVMQRAAALVRRDRLAALPGQGARAGLAEFLDLLRALAQIAPGQPALQSAWMERLSPYVLLKQGQDQAAQTHSLPDPRDARKVGVE